MKKILLLLLLCSSCLFSQEENQLPNFTLPSPQAFQMTKYGDVPVNESSGRVTSSIPLDSYVNGSLQLPLSLSYIGNGVKVDQLNTWTGVNWTLNAGGVITRIVNDFPDELSPNRIHLNSVLFNDINFEPKTSDIVPVQPNENTLNFLNIASPVSQNDTEHDIFSFSFAGYSGSFYLDENYLPTLTKKDSPLRIEVLGNTRESLINLKTFIITTPKGVKYFFGGTDATEESFSEDKANQANSGPVAITSFYLQKIVHHLGDAIFFEYENKLLKNRIDYKYPNSAIDVYISPNPYTGDYCLPPPSLENVFPLSPPIIQGYFTTINNQKILKRIYTTKNDGYEVIFHHNTELINGFTRRNKLDKITISGQKEIDLSYKFSGEDQEGDKFFLTEVKVKSLLNTTVNEEQIYTLEYDSLEVIPNRFSFNQDHLGYFNGKFNVTNLPRHYPGDPGYDTFIDKFDSDNYSFADKSPDFQYSKSGTLSRIYYPTGGHTLFEYEPHFRKRLVTEIKNLYVFSSPSVPNADLIDSEIIGSTLFLEGGVPPVEGVFEEQVIKVKFGINAPSSLMINNQNGVQIYDPQNRDFIRFKISDNTTQETHYITGSSADNYRLNLGNIKDAIGSTREFMFTLKKDHHYSFSLELFSFDAGQETVWGLPNQDIGVSANFEYIKGYEWDVQDLGLRVKRVSDFTQNDGIPSNIKRYYYKELEKLHTPEESPFEVYNRPNYIRTKKETVCQVCNENTTLCKGYYDVGYTILESDQTGNMFPTKDGNLFKAVTISYGGDNFENGGVEKKFYMSRPVGMFAIHGQNQTGIISKALSSKTDNSNIFNGSLISETYLKKKNVNFFKLKKVEYNYDRERDSYVTNTHFQNLRKFQGRGGADVAFHTIADANDIIHMFDLFIGEYRTYSYKNNLLSQTTTDYIEPLALGADENTVNRVITNIDYEYGDLSGLPIKTTTTNSDGKQQIVKNYYPNQVIDVNSLNLQPALTPIELTSISNLTTQNRLSPIQVESFEKLGVNPEVLISAQRSVYKEENNLTQLKSVSSSKNSSGFEERVVYHQYDLKGNPLELSKSDGTKVVYKWSANHRKPLAKIINANLIDVQNAQGDLRTAFPHAQVTSYTYTGVLNLLSTVTDPRGYTTIYIYDELNRLKFVKDAEGNVLSENDYNYRPQN